MSLDSPLKLGYGTLVLKGLLAAVAPRKAIVLVTAGWRVGFENVGDLQPREWYVDATRAAGVGLLVAGLTGLLLVGGNDTSDGDGGTSTDIDTDDGSDGPIEVDIDR